MRRTPSTSVLAATIVAAALAAPAAAAEAEPPDAGAAATVPVAGAVVVEAQADPGPGDPGRCTSTVYVQFAEVPGASGYTATYRVQADGSTHALAGPPFDDVIDHGAFHSVAPPGAHRLSLRTYYTTAAGCADARAVQTGRYALLATTAVVPQVVPPRAVAAIPPPDPGDTFNCAGSTWSAANDWFWTYVGYHGDVGRLDNDGDLLPCETLTGAPVTPTLPAPFSGAGYWMLGGDGQVYGFGDAWTVPGRPPGTAVAIAAGPGGGYRVLAADGAVHGRLVAAHGGVAPGTLAAGEVPSTLAATPDGTGYWVFTNRGRAVPFGSAVSYGDMRATPLNGPIVAAAATPSGRGYWMVGSDGGIFSFGDAAFSGSTGDLRLNQPVVGIAPDPDGAGYWLVAADGGIFAFDAPFRGSVPQALAPGTSLNRPVIGAIAYGDGYLLVASDGGVFAFSDLPFLGSLGGTTLGTPIVAVAVVHR